MKKLKARVAPRPARYPEAGSFWALPGLLLAMLLLAGAARARAEGTVPELPATSLGYEITARIDPATRALSGREIIKWTNRSSGPVSRVPLHLYLNAFSHSGTTWMRGVQASFGRWVDPERMLEQDPDPWGRLRLVSVHQLAAGKKRRITFRPIQPDDGNVLDRTLVELALPRDVAPGQVLQLEVAFEGRMPVPIARTGCHEDFCLVAQWFPKVGVLEPAGVRRAPQDRWAARQFHGPTEFYADFADYDVTVQVPAGWIVAATGQRRPATGRSPEGWQKVRHVQRAVHDFALVLGKDLHRRTIPHWPAGGGPRVQVSYLLPSAMAHQLGRVRGALEGGLDCMGRAVGPYPYTTLTVVLPPFRSLRTGGMEYPTFITSGPADPLWDGFPLSGVRMVEGTTVHELIHQYFYGLVANNEQVEAFLDEGLASYWEQRCMGDLTAAGQVGPNRLLGRVLDFKEMRGGSPGPVDEPIRQRPSALFYPGKERLQIYIRPAQMLLTAEGLFGRARVDRVFARYFARQRFHHPHTEDFLLAAREAGGQKLEAFLREALLRPAPPDFQVVLARAGPYRLPLGHLPAGKGSMVVIGEGMQQEIDRLPKDRRMYDKEGQVWVEVTDPGWSRAGQDHPGGVRWEGFRPARWSGAGKEPWSPDPRTPLYESEARIRGPAWDSLPVEVVLRFADGAEVRETWDGRASWRGYRTVRPAPLSEVRIDPRGRVALDSRPGNNSRSVRPDRGFAADWGLWLGALAQWLAGGLSQWL